MRMLEAQLRSDADVIEDLETSLQVLIGQASENGIAPDSAAVERIWKSLHGKRRKIMRRLFAQAATLSSDTQWEQPLLLDRIGCKNRTEADLHELGTDRLQDCDRFLQLLADAAAAVSTVATKRAAVVTLARLIRQTDQTAEGLAELLEIGDPSPWQYMRLGELAQAARVARINAGSPRPEDHDLPPLTTAGAAAHISMPRLDAYLRGESAAFGDAVFARIDDHVRDCAACSAAARHRRSRLAA